MIRTQVLVVGAGPVGATAAYRLAKAGLDVLLIEAGTHCPEDMRASTLHPPTLEMLSSLGVLDELEAVGLRAPVYHYLGRSSGAVVRFDLSELSDLTPHPYRLQCEQFKLARLMVERLRGLNPDCVRFNHRALSFEQDTKGVRVSIETPMEILEVQADYVIACDGSNSTLRKWTGAHFDGFTYPERFLTLSTRYPLHEDIANLAQVNYVADPGCWSVLLRVPDFWRVLVPTDAEIPDEYLLSDEKKTSVFDTLIQKGAEIETYHRTLYRVHQRVASSFHFGRVLLAGDSAHLNNPLGGFGMNSSIHDIWNLTDKLLAIYQDGAEAQGALALYDRQRRAVAHSFVQAQTIKNKELLEQAREHELAAIAEDDERRCPDFPGYACGPAACLYDDHSGDSGLDGGDCHPHSQALDHLLRPLGGRMV